MLATVGGRQNLVVDNCVLIETKADNTTAETTTIDYVTGLDQIQQTTTEIDNTGAVISVETVTFAYDGRMTVRSLLDVAGAIAVIDGSPQVFVFDAYGTRLDDNEAATTLLFHSQHHDPNTNWNYHNARWYQNGQWNRLDPFAGNANDPKASTSICTPTPTRSMVSIRQSCLVLLCFLYLLVQTRNCKQQIKRFAITADRRGCPVSI